MTVYYYVPESSEVGVNVITTNFVNTLKNAGINCINTDTLPPLKKGDIVVPGGVKNALKFIETKENKYLVLLGDAISLGYLNKVKFYLKNGHVLNKDFLYSIYGYFRYRREEKRCINTYDHVILFSNTDIEYFKKLAPKSECNYYCIPNGAYFPKIKQNAHIPKGVLKIGILSSWTSFQSYEENNWFIKKYFRRYYKNNRSVELILAGRGSFINKFKSEPGVRVIGEVDTLGDFFSQIDLFLSVNPKGCGILNRVLDAMAYNVPVMGIRGSFSGFPNSDDIFWKFDDYSSFAQTMESFLNNQNRAKGMVLLADDYAHKNHEWSRNYKQLINIINILKDKV